MITFSVTNLESEGGNIYLLTHDQHQTAPLMPAPRPPTSNEDLEGGKPRRRGQGPSKQYPDSVCKRDENVRFQR